MCLLHLTSLPFAINFSLIYGNLHILSYFVHMQVQYSHGHFIFLNYVIWLEDVFAQWDSLSRFPYHFYPEEREQCVLET